MTTTTPTTITLTTITMTTVTMTTTMIITLVGLRKKQKKRNTKLKKLSVLSWLSKTIQQLSKWGISLKISSSSARFGDMTAG